jgi:SagB-type dehydrogenase family enzyme
MISDTYLMQEYELLVANRHSDAVSALAPSSGKVDWHQSPSKFTTYHGSDRVPLCLMLDAHRVKDNWELAATAEPRVSAMSIREISDLLMLCFGVLRRRLTIDWSSKQLQRSRSEKTSFARSTPSGGGLYPIETYLVSTGKGELLSGIYHYDVAQHALARLRMGKYVNVISEALNYPGWEAYDVLLVLTAHFRKSVFKYHNFAYQLATLDVGASVATVEHVASAMGWKLSIIYWFNDEIMNSLLGTDINQSSPFIMLGLSINETSERESPQKIQERTVDETGGSLPPIRARVCEQANKANLPELLLTVNRATLLQRVERPLDLLGTPATVTQRIERLNPNGNVGLPDELRDRETSWGQFRRAPALKFEILDEVLSAGANGTQYRTDLFGNHSIPSFVRLFVIANSIASLDRGVYEYGFTNSQLSERIFSPVPSSLQEIYRLQNFNLDQISAVLVVVGRLDLALKAVGARGVRVMNAEAGMIAQRIYIASGAKALGCGTVAGFDAAQVAAMVGIGMPADVPLLLIFVGSQVQHVFGYDFSLE